MCFVCFTASQERRVAALQRNGWEVFLTGWQTCGQTTATAAPALWLLVRKFCNTEEKLKYGVVECKGNRGFLTVIIKSKVSCILCAQQFQLRWYVRWECLFSLGCRMLPVWTEVAGKPPHFVLSQMIRLCFSKVQFQINLAKTLAHFFQKILPFFLM